MSYKSFSVVVYKVVLLRWKWSRLDEDIGGYRLVTQKVPATEQDRLKGTRVVSSQSWEGSYQ